MSDLQVFQEAVDQAQAALDEAMEARTEFLEDVEATKYAVKLAGGVVDDDDDLPDAQQDELDKIDDAIVEAEATFSAAKKSFFEHKAPVQTGWLVLKVNKDDESKRSKIGGGSKKRWVVLKQGVITAYEDDTPDAEVLVAVDEIVILLHPPLPLVGVSTVMERGGQ